MDSPPFIKSDSAILLLNEIDILLAQTRLVELYLKQSQATAAHETARIHEEYQAELKRLSLRPALGDNEQPSSAHQTTVGAAEQKLRHSALQNQLSEKQRLLESRDIELQNAKSETAILRDRIAELETARQQAQAVEQEFAISRQDLQVELAALRHQLEIKQADFEKQQLISRALQERLEEQLAQLQDQLREGQTTSQGVASELRQARIEIAASQAQIAKLQTSRHEARAIAAHELEQTRVRFEAEIAGLQISLAERDRALEETGTTIAEIERGVKTDILTLRSQLEQKQELVEFRDDELRDAHGQLAALQQRIIELESANQSAAANAEEIERIRRSFESDLAALQREVAIKELALTERQEAVTATELALHSEIEALRQEQARSRSIIDKRENELHSSRAEVATFRERISQLEAAAAADLTTRQLGDETRRSLEAELTSLHATLAQKEYALKEQQNFFQSVEDRLGSELNQLRSELARQRTATDASNTEVERLRSEITALQQQTAQSELSRRQLEENWQQTVALSQDLEARLQTKDDELRAAQANVQEQKEAALREQEKQLRSAEDRLAAEINQLRGELAQQQTASEASDAELERLRSQIIGLREQSAQSELSRRETEEDRQHAEAQRQELEARLQAKDDELGVTEANAQEQKETALREQEILFRAIEDRLAAEINQLRTQLEEQYGLSGQGNAELERLRSEIAELQERNEQSGRLRRELEENWQRAVASEQELQTSLLAKEDEFHAVQTKGDEFKVQLEAAIGQLQLQLTERGLLAESRAAEIGNLQADINRLSEQLAQRESAQTAAQGNFREEIESSLAAHRAEITALREEHRGKQQQLENDLSQQRQNAVELRSQIADREHLVDEAQTALKIRERDLDSAATEAATFRARLHELETTSQAEKAAAKTESDHALNRLETELVSLRTDLQQKAWALAQQQATLENLALAHKSQIHNLEAKLAEQQHGIKDRNLDLEKAQSRSHALQRRIEELETELQHVQLAALSRAEQMTQDYGAQIDDLSSQLAQKTSVLQERDRAESNIEHTLRSELDRLIREAEERNQILQNRNDELVRVKAEMDSLHERFTQLESSASENEAAAAADSEQMRTELQAQLALLQVDVSQKEWALEERRASASAVEQRYRQEIEELRQKVLETEAPAKADRDEFVLGQDRITDEQQERRDTYREIIDQVTSGPNQSFPASEGRRWRTGFGWKRRWKS